MPFGPLRVRVTKDGYVPVNGTMNTFTASYKLDRVDEMPEGMIRIPATRSQVGQSAANVPEYFSIGSR